MKLFCDLDETLVYAFPRGTRGEVRPTNLTPSARIEFSPTEQVDLYFRPDLELLRETPFVILSVGTEEYVRRAAQVLREFLPIKGWVALEAMQALLKNREIVTDEPSLLIDNLAPRVPGAVGKMKLLPNGSYCRVDGWEPPPFQRSVLQLMRRRGSRPLAGCLEAYHQGE